jgi:hypothetical protein
MAWAPAVRHVEHEPRVGDGVQPDLVNGELGPLGHPDVVHLVLAQELLAALDDILEEAQWAVLKVREQIAL